MAEMLQTAHSDVVDTGVSARGSAPAVEATESRGVIRVLSEDALPPLDRAAASDELLARVKQTDFSDADALDSIGGLAEVVREARRLVLLPVEEPERFEKLGGAFEGRQQSRPFPEISRDERAQEVGLGPPRSMCWSEEVSRPSQCPGLLAHPGTAFGLHLGDIGR